MAKPDNPPAFPNAIDNEGGMTLRDYFAAKAMQGLAEYYFCMNQTYNEKVMLLVDAAFTIADAMLEKRSK